jgi:signal peptidase II
MKTYRLYALLLAAAILVVDQWSKAVILNLHGPMPGLIAEITSFFNLVMVWNHGVSFGLFDEHQGEKALLLVAVTGAITLALFVWLMRCQSRLLAIGIGLVIGGAIGNIIDRLRFGAVVDFLDFHAYGYHWPAFNVADASIFIGVVLLFADSMIEARQNKTKQGNAHAQDSADRPDTSH